MHDECTDNKLNFCCCDVAAVRTLITVVDRKRIADVLSRPRFALQQQKASMTFGIDQECPFVEVSIGFAAFNSVLEVFWVFSRDE